MSAKITKTYARHEERFRRYLPGGRVLPEDRTYLLRLVARETGASIEAVARAVPLGDRHPVTRGIE